MKTFDCHLVDGKPAFNRPDFEGEISQYPYCRITVEAWSETKEKTYQQCRWWHGVLLAGLARQTGYTKDEWARELKKRIIPDEFKEVRDIETGEVFTKTPSVRDLSCKKMNQLIEGSVAYLQSIGFTQITLPNSDLRKE